KSSTRGHTLGAFNDLGQLDSEPGKPGPKQGSPLGSAIVGRDAVWIGHLPYANQVRKGLRRCRLGNEVVARVRVLRVCRSGRH
ncbi:MAG: hypothetical protein NZ609_08560, partial [Acidimicrobiales bacterium]|nr:hypothetical protein [Acidimicrobiales bacterium]